MPLRPLYRPVEPPPPVVEPSPTPAPPPPDVPYVEWTPPVGASLILSQSAPSGIHLGGVDAFDRTIIGLDMPPQEEVDTQLPGGGELANSRRWLARLFALPVVIHADTLSELQEYRRRLMSAFNPALGEGVFTVAYPMGRRRHLNARYTSGLDVAEIGRSGDGLYRDSFMINMKARDPFPYGDPIVHRFDPPQSYQFYAPPGDPNVFYISSSVTTADFDVTIDGDVEVWPVWVIRGPATTVTLRNRDTGKTLSLTPNLAVNQTLTVRSDPRTAPTRRFTRESGVSVWASVAGQFPVMWSLRPGLNRITVLVNGTVPGQSYTEMTYRPRDLSL